MSEERLDEETERLIFNVTDAGIAHGFAHEDAPTDQMNAAENALRSRIRTLVEEARREGYESDKAFRLRDETASLESQSTKDFLRRHPT